MLKSKIKFARPARKKVSALGLSASGARLAATRETSPKGGQPSAFAWSGFTLIELLVVIAILGIMAGLTVPVLKNFAKSDATLGASRQLLDGVARARQLAISQRTTVYMVFVPTNFWIVSGSFPTPNAWWQNLTLAQQTAATNLCDKQLSGYTFIARGAMGDQPGNHQWHYLAPWQALPDGTFIAYQKFAEASNNWYTITDPIDASKSYNIYGFSTRSDIPFPTETVTNTARVVNLPYIAFNYLGQLVSEVDSFGNYRDAYIPIAKGSVLVVKDPGTKGFLLPGAPPIPNSPDVAENPPGNSTNSSYNIVHIERLTGRAVLEYQKMAP